MRVLVCGGRDFFAELWLKKELCDLVWQRGRFAKAPAQIKTLIHGGARGADLMAANFGIGCGLEVIEFKADWNKFGHAAGPIRNKQMIEEGKPDMAVAFPGGEGTANMISQLIKAGIPVYILKSEDR